MLILLISAALYLLSATVLFVEFKMIYRVPDENGVARSVKPDPSVGEIATSKKRSTSRSRSSIGLDSVLASEVENAAATTK